MKSVTFTLFDTFNACRLSTHKTLAAALKARQSHAKRLRKYHRSNGFVNYAIKRSDDAFIKRDEMIDAEIAAGIY